MFTNPILKIKKSVTERAKTCDLITDRYIADENKKMSLKINFPYI